MSISKIVDFLKWGRITKIGCYCPVCLKHLETTSTKDFDPEELVRGEVIKRFCRCGASKTLRLGELFLYLFRKNEKVPHHAYDFERQQPSIRERQRAKPEIYDKDYVKKFGNRNKQLVSAEDIRALKPFKKAKTF